MDFFPRSSIRAKTLVLTIALAFGSASFASAHDASHHAPGAAPQQAASEAGVADEERFLDENDAAMTKMMNDMAVKSTGDVDRDFVAMMVPHHQGAIDMAQVLLRYGRNEQLRRLAQEIIVTQQQEIAAMRLAVGEPLPPSVPSPTQPSPVPAPDHRAMSQGAMTMSPGTNMNEEPK